MSEDAEAQLRQRVRDALERRLTGGGENPPSAGEPETPEARYTRLRATYDDMLERAGLGPESGEKLALVFALTAALADCQQAQVEYQRSQLIAVIDRLDAALEQRLDAIGAALVERFGATVDKRVAESAARLPAAADRMAAQVRFYLRWKLAALLGGGAVLALMAGMWLGAAWGESRVLAQAGEDAQLLAAYPEWRRIVQLNGDPSRCVRVPTQSGEACAWWRVAPQ